MCYTLFIYVKCIFLNINVNHKHFIIMLNNVRFTFLSYIYIIIKFFILFLVFLNPSPLGYYFFKFSNNLYPFYTEFDLIFYTRKRCNLLIITAKIR